MLQVVPVRLGHPSVHCHFHPHDLIHQPVTESCNQAAISDDHLAAWHSVHIVLRCRHLLVTPLVEQVQCELILGIDDPDK